MSKILSLFAGAGGFDLGAILAGNEIVWSNDFDKNASATYNENIEKYMPHTHIEGDIIKYLDSIKITSLPDHDILIGGFPCQGFTVANLKRSINDPRSQLYKQVIRVLKAKKPKYFLLENVKGLTNIEKGDVLKFIVEELAKIGYDVEWKVFASDDFGVPQKRERVFILGKRRDLKNDMNILDKVVPTHSLNAKKNRKSPLSFVNDSYNTFKKGGDLKYKFPSEIYSKRVLGDALKSVKNQHIWTKHAVKITGYVGNRALNINKPAPTITGRGSGGGGPVIHPHPDLQRRLSVRETANIQTFPSEFIFSGPMSRMYAQIGNAVPVLMAYEIMGQLQRFLK